MDARIIKIMAIRDLERNLSKNMQEMGWDTEITVSEITRKIAKEKPELLKEIDHAIDIINSHSEKKQ